MRTLAIAGSIIIIVVFTAIFLNAFIEQETAVFQYENEAHQNACETYERAEAPEWYLFQNNCK